MAYTEFYCNASTGSNMNGGSDQGGAAVYTSTNGNWTSATQIFIPTDGSNPVSGGVTVGMWAHVYLDGSTTPLGTARVTAVVNAANGSITLSATQKGGSQASTGATGRTIKVGGTWKGPNATDGWPISVNLQGAQVNATDVTRVNFKNNSTYSITAVISSAAAQNVVFQGYASTAGDGSRATISGGGNAIQLLANGAGAYIDLIFSNVGVTTGTNSGVGITTGGYLLRCVVHDIRGVGIVSVAGAPVAIIETEVYAANLSNTADTPAIQLGDGSSRIHRCYIHDNTTSNTDGMRTGTGNTTSHISYNIFESNGRNGIRIASSTSSSQNHHFIANNDFYNNGAAGIALDNSNGGNYFLFIENNNFVKNATYGFEGNTAFTRLFGYLYNNGYGTGTQANGSGDYHNTGTLQLDDGTGNSSRVVYASNLTPWNAPTTGDFKIALAAAMSTGRGAWTQTDGTNTGSVGFPDIGAVPHQDTSITPTPVQRSYVWGG